MSRQISKTPMRVPAGLNNTTNTIGLWRDFGAMDPTRFQDFKNDFLTYAAGDYTITQTGGSAALAAGSGGWLALTASTGGTDSIYMQHVAASWAMEAGKRAWFETRFKLSAITAGTAIIGLVATDTTPETNTDGIYFHKNVAGTGVVDFVVKGSSTATTASTITTLAADTFVRLGFFYNGVDAIEYFVDGVKAGTSVSTNLPSANLTFTMGVAATTATARVLTIDYVAMAKERLYANSPI